MGTYKETLAPRTAKDAVWLQHTGEVMFKAARSRRSQGAIPLQSLAH